MIALVAQPWQYLLVVTVDDAAAVAAVRRRLLASWRRAGRRPWLE